RLSAPRAGRSSAAGRCCTILIARQRPDLLALKPGKAGAVLPARPWRTTILAVLVWGAIWAAPMALIAATLGESHVLWQVGAFFSQLAIVTFGGAYAVLAYMAQEAVQGFGWLQPGEMADGLGLAETTPGPLILVTQFVGYLAAFRAPEPFTPLVAGLLGAGLTTWVTFAPCFLWIFALAPWIDRLGQAVWLKGGLAAVTAAVVGVIANLTVWFALHVLFARVGAVEAGPLRLSWPELASFDWRAGVLAALAFALAFGAKWGVLRLLAVCAAGGLALVLVG
ncbi:chromate transporter, partial [Erythrobacter donghaensis]|uniref:chromate transporter n=1 Tax=Erythrobacter donghaensis TaxID=267135 RepID=UPI000A87D345